MKCKVAPSVPKILGGFKSVCVCDSAHLKIRQREAEVTLCVCACVDGKKNTRAGTHRSRLSSSSLPPIVVDSLTETGTSNSFQRTLNIHAQKPGRPCNNNLNSTASTPGLQSSLM